MTEPSVRRAGITLLAFVIIAKAVGFLREIVIAGTYGASQVVDVYLAAVTVPALIVGILYQALPNAFVPLFARGGYGHKPSQAVAWGVLACMAALSTGLWLFAVPIASLTNAGFAAPLKAETVVLLHIVAGSVFLGTVEALTRSRLLAQKRFVQTGISSVWSSLAIIVAISFFPEGGTRTLAWGFLAGAACVAAWNLFPFGPRRAIRPADVAPSDLPASGQSAVWWVAAVLLLNTISLLYGLIDRHLGSFLAEGSIAALQYANAVASQPLAICATALGTAIFPYLSDRISANDHDGSASLFDRAMRWALLGAIPSAVVMVMLGQPIIGVLFERGEFDAAARSLTGGLLSAYGVWVLPAVLGTVIGKVFYAGFRWRPIFVAIGTALLVKAGLSYWWVRAYDAVGLVAATAAASVVSIAVMLVLLPKWSVHELWIDWLRLAAVTAILFLIPCYLGSLIPDLLPMFSWKVRALLGILTGVGGGACGLLIFGPRLGVMEMVKVRIAVEAVLLHRR